VFLNLSYFKMEGLIIGVPISFTKTKQFKTFMKSLMAVNGSLFRFVDTVNLIHHIKSLQSVFDSLGRAEELGSGASWSDVESEVIKKSSKDSKQDREWASSTQSNMEEVAGGASTVSVCGSGQHLKSNRRRGSAGVPKDAGNLAGETPHRDGVE
jgi:hypothetical protein